MTLLEILAVTNEGTDVNVYNLERELISFYDGKNSIDMEYNDLEVVEISTSNNAIEIIVRIWRK